MKTLFSKHRWMQIVFGGLFLIAGALLTIISLSAMKEGSELKPDVWLSVILASACFIFGIVCITSGIFSLKEKRFSSLFPLGAVAIALGVVMCYKPALLGEYVIVLLGAFTLSFAAIEIAEAVSMIFFKQKKFYIVIFFVIGALLVVAGILAIVFQNEIKNVIYVVLGGALGLFGVIEIINGIRVAIAQSKTSKKEERKQNDAPAIQDDKPADEIEA